MESSTQMPSAPRAAYTLRIILVLLLALVTVTIVVSWEKSNHDLGGNVTPKTVEKSGYF